jgi:hypothetical protein
MLISITAYVPTAISSSVSLGERVSTITLMHGSTQSKWLNDNAERPDVVAMWWDYGNF